MNSYDYMSNKFPGRKAGDVVRCQCPECNNSDSLVWSVNKPHPYICHACGIRGNAYSHGYTDEGFQKTDQSPTDKAVARYRKKTGKNHRLTSDVIAAYGLKMRDYISSQGNNFSALTLFDEHDQPIKRLSGEKWIAMKKNDMPPGQWLGVSNLKSSSDDIYVTAGEWDMFSLLKHAGIASISPAYGESHGKDWRNKIVHLDIFANKNVVILYDNDTTGRSGSNNLARAIARHVKTKSIKVVDLAEIGVGGGGDLDDYFNLGGTVERLNGLIDNTPSFDSSVVFSSLPKLSDRVIPCPENTDSVLDKEALDVLWRVAIKPISLRNKVLRELAVDEVGESNAKIIKAQISIYNQEIETLKAIGQKSIVDLAISNAKLVNYRPIGSGDSAPQTYYYSDGVYHRFTEEKLNQMVEEIINVTQPPDDRLKLSTLRKVVKQDINIAISLLPLSKFEDDFKTKYVNTKSGLFNIETSEVEEHRSSILSRYQLASSIDSSVEPENFKNAIDTWFESESERREFLKFCYYTISGNRSSHIAAVFRGDGGNGKGEAVKVLQDLVGQDRTTGLRMEHLKNDVLLSSLSTSLLNISDEVSKKGMVPDGQLKAVTGESLLVANPKYRDQYSFRSRAQWVIVSNHQLSTSDVSDGMMRRFKFFHFRYLPEDKREANYYNNKIKPELPGIIYYVLTEGKKMWDEENGFCKISSDEIMKDDLERRNSVSGYLLDLMDQLKSKELEDNEKETYRIFEEKTIAKGINKGSVVQYIDPLRHYVEYLEYCRNNGQKEVSLGNFKSDIRSFIARRLRGGTLDKFRLQLSSTQFYLSDIKIGRDQSSLATIKKKTRRVFALTRINENGKVIPVSKDPFWMNTTNEKF